MTYSLEQNDIIFKMRDAGDSWAAIGRALGKSADAVRIYYQPNVARRDLPPKTIIPKPLTDGRVGLKIKRIIQDNP